MVLILIYVSFRFDYRFGTAAVIALFHDAIITIGVLVLTQKEFSIVIVGALLTIIGYSINDSIVISDRIRALLIFGGAVIADFAFTLLVGFLIGTYSSIFIVANIVSVWEEKFPKKKK